MDFQYNRISAECTVAPCLRQVAGYVDHNPVAQFSACQSVFGFPVVPTVTLAVDPILSTSIATSTYIDVVISTSTVYSTLEQASTSYATVYQTATEYTTTLVNTLTTTVAPAVSAVPKKRSNKKRGHHKRGNCKHSTSSGLSSSSEAPSSTTSSSALFPIATNCPSLAEYSSACACLEPATVTEYASAATSVVLETATTTIPSTTEAVVTVAVTTVVVKPATATLVSTLTTLTATTTIATVTATPAPVVPQTFELVVADGPNAGVPVVTNGVSPAFTLAWVNGRIPVSLGLTSAGTIPFLTSNTAFKMYVRASTSAYGIVFFTTPSYASTTSYAWLPVTCSLAPSTLVMSCSTTGYGFTRFLSCGTTLGVCLGQRAYRQRTPFQCPGGVVVNASRTQPTQDLVEDYALHVQQGALTYDAMVLTAQWAWAGTVSLDGVEETTMFASQDAFEFILLSRVMGGDDCDQNVMVGDDFQYHAMLLQWNGPVAERRGLGVD
ncbi:hypothetical protein B0T22DRAFT_494774 [Podospora appendiculata]|uniref:Uncharacterized protein n=1 Tax=Podospora appendiculata TaxID=314037 RepID=A0AAE0WZV9_9PEZI|nr:hypothetical protein B0T22DRAFT_494774 [Podospora appendiculata]